MPRALARGTGGKYGSIPQVMPRKEREVWPKVIPFPSECVPHPHVDTPVEMMPDIILNIIEEHSIARTEVKLQSERDIQLILQSQHGIDPELSHIPIEMINTRTPTIPRITQTHTTTGKAIKSRYEVAFIQEVRVQLQIPKIIRFPFCTMVLSLTVGTKNFGTQIYLNGKMVGYKSLVGEGLHTSKSGTDTVFVRSLGFQCAH